MDGLLLESADGRHSDTIHTTDAAGASHSIVICCPLHGMYHFPVRDGAFWHTGPCPTIDEMRGTHGSVRSWDVVTYVDEGRWKVAPTLTHLGRSGERCDTLS